MLVVGEHDRDRALDVGQAGVEQRPAGAGGVHDVAVAEQDQRVDALVPHGRPQPRAAFAVHPGAVGQCPGCRAATIRRESANVGHEIPRNFLMLVLTIFTASSGPTASTTAASDFSE